MKRITILFEFTAVLLAAFLSIGASNTPGDSRTNNDDWKQQLKKYAEIYMHVKNTYPDPVNDEKLCFESINGLLHTLDPHSYFLDPVEVRSFNEDQQGNYYGIGTRITKFGDQLTVVEIIKDTPAEKFGLMVGDIIAEIDKKPTKNLSVDNSMRLLRGAKNTEVEITIKRDDPDKMQSYKIPRAEIPLYSISYAFSFPKEPGIGYMNIRTFGNTTADEVDNNLKQLLQKNKISGLILDLRGNSGGLLYAAVDIADFFLEKGKTIVSIKGRAYNQDFTAKRSDPYEKLPIAVLINRGSASASEIVASALQDHHRAKIIGSRSWGKGLVQTVNRLSFNTSLALTTAKYYTPSNKCLQRDFAELDDYFFFLNNKDYDTNTSIVGGVIPDMLIKSEIYPQTIGEWVNNGIFFRFALYLERKKIPITSSFVADASIIDLFKKFLDLKKVKYPGETIKTHEESIRVEIEREALSRKFSSTEGARVFLESDPATQKAIEILKNSLKKN